MTGARHVPSRHVAERPDLNGLNIAVCQDGHDEWVGPPIPLARMAAAAPRRDASRVANKSRAELLGVPSPLLLEGRKCVGENYMHVPRHDGRHRKLCTYMYMHLHVLCVVCVRRMAEWHEWVPSSAVSGQDILRVPTKKTQRAIASNPGIPTAHLPPPRFAFFRLNLSLTPLSPNRHIPTTMLLANVLLLGSATRTLHIHVHPSMCLPTPSTFRVMMDPME